MHRQRGGARRTPGGGQAKHRQRGAPVRVVRRQPRAGFPGTANQVTVIVQVVEVSVV